MASRGWFLYNGGFHPGGVNNALNYIYTTVMPVCIVGTDLCAIRGIYQPVPYGKVPAPGSFSYRIQTYIADVLATGSRQPTIGFITGGYYALPKP